MFVENGQQLFFVMVLCINMHILNSKKSYYDYMLHSITLFFVI